MAPPGTRLPVRDRASRRHRGALPGMFLPLRTIKVRVRKAWCRYACGVAESGPLMPDLALPLATAGLAHMCLVLDTAAVEVIPTNDLPPSTPP
jgi:hypothetical protein